MGSLPTPKHYWNFDEGSGTQAKDSSGKLGVNLDRPGWTQGKWGKALRLHPEEGVQQVHLSAEDLPPPWTAALWVKREEESETSSLLSSPTHALRLEQWPSKHTLGITRFGVADWDFGYEAPLQQWVHVAVVGTASDTLLYVNGSLQGTIPQGLPLPLQGIGSRQESPEQIRACIDELRIYDTALTESQLQELSKLDPAPTPPPAPTPAPPPRKDKNSRRRK